MATLVYQRTHNGDPDKWGRFGCANCMGRVRSWDFDSVIGVGGQGADAIESEIARKLCWIGIGAHKTMIRGMKYPVVTFDHFLPFGTDGHDLEVEAPNLARRMYVKKVRATMRFSSREQIEIDELLELAKHSSPSRSIRMRTLSALKAMCHTANC